MITLSKSAKEHIQTQLKKSDVPTFFYLGIKKMGCSGYVYQVSIKNEIESSNEYLEVEGIPFLIEQAWKSILENVSIDYVEDTHALLKTKKLIFSHPDVQTHCGCGESFYLPGQ